MKTSGILFRTSGPNKKGKDIQDQQTNKSVFLLISATLCVLCVSDSIIAGVSDGFAIGIITVAVIIAALLAALIVVMIRHYRAQDTLVVGEDDDPDKKLTTGR